MIDVQQTERELKILLTKSQKDPYYVFTNKDCHTTAFCTRFIEQCNEIVFDAPSATLELAFLVRRLAQETKDPHLVAKSEAVVGSGYRVEGIYERATQSIRRAERLAADCSCCLSDIYRRKGINLFHQNRPREMYRVLTEAMSHYETIGDSDGIGRVFIHRGAGLWLEGRTDEALEEERRGLVLFTRDTTPSRYYLAGMVNIATFLAYPQEELDAALKLRRSGEAMQYLSMIREELKGSKRRHEVVRVFLRWIEGLICVTRGERRRAFRLLISARNGVQRLGLRTEYLAASSDLAKLYKIGTPRSNDDQVISIARECLVHGRPTAEEKHLLQELTQTPELPVIEKLREIATCRVPVMI
ncbi:MAG: hypothetical protein GY722_29455 [bacterium]|nr:hypothetical protein [bacterium]